MFNTGIIGFGYWGPILTRYFHQHPGFVLKRIADNNSERLKVASESYPTVDITADVKANTQGDDIDLVIVATPLNTHYELALDAITNSKHVWLEKPMTMNSSQGEHLCQLADKNGKIVLVDFPILFTHAAETIKSFIQTGKAGTLSFYNAQRINTGPYRCDASVTWDLASHDLAMMLYLLGAKVKSVSTTGQKDANGNLLEIGSITVQLDDIIANIYVNRQAPLKIRKTMIGGDEAMILWNELDQLEPVKIYNHDIGSKEGNCSYQCRHRAGAVFSPMVQEGETLLKEVEYFFQCLENKCQPVNNAQFGLQVVRLLEATEESLARNAALVEVKECKLNSFPII